MAKVYKVYDAQKNEFFSTHTDEQEATADVDSLCSLDQTLGMVFEVHEFDEADVRHLHPRVVYRRRG